MINFRSPYDSTEIREGLMNIKHSQMELLNQLKNENHILKKYTPQNPIFQQRSESNLYQTSSPGYSTKQNFQSSHMSSNNKSPYNPTSSFLSNNNNNNPFTRDYDDNRFVSSANKNPTTSLNSNSLEKELQNMTQEFHRMKKNFFTEKQKNKDMVLHMEFAASLHNMILKDLLQGVNLDSIKTRIRTEVQAYQGEFAEFKAFGLEQAFNIINLQSDSSFLGGEPRTPGRRQIFPTKPFQQQQNTELLKELNDLKCELRQLSLEKQRKSQQVVLMKSETDYTTSLLSKELQMKNAKISELVSQIIKYKQSSKSLSSQNADLRSNIDRLKSELQRNLNKIQVLENFQRKTTDTIDKEHKNMKYVKELEDKVAFLEKESREKSKLIEIHQQNVNKTNQNLRSLKADYEKLKGEYQEIKQSHQKKSMNLVQSEHKLQSLQKSHSQELALLNRRNQTEQTSLKQHITELKRSIQQLLMQQESYKLSEQSLQEIKHRKMETVKFSKTIDHLWKIKEVEYENIAQVLTQLNLISSFERSSPQQQLHSSSKNFNITHKQSRTSSRKQKEKLSSSSKDKINKERKNNRY